MTHRTAIRSRRRETARRRRPFSPGLGPAASRLEDRTLLASTPPVGPTVIKVNTYGDTLDPSANLTASQIAAASQQSNPPTVSLRDAVVAATNTNTTNPIEIDLPATDPTNATTLRATTYNLSNSGAGEMNLGLYAGQNITIKSINGSNATINQTLTDTRIFDIDDSYVGNIAVTLQGLTLQGTSGVDEAFGGGAIVAGAPGDVLTINSCTFQNNSTTSGDNGGAISFSGGGNLIISNSTFTNNVAAGAPNNGTTGGAIDFDDENYAGYLSISNSTFTNNRLAGAGIGSHGGAVEVIGTGNNTITGCTFTNNSAGTGASSQGGGVYFFSNTSGGVAGSLAISNSTFTGNSAPLGGGIYAESGGTTTGIVTLTGSRLTGNSASSASSGLYNRLANVTASNDWWGADAYPGAAGTDTVTTSGGSTNVSPHLSLALSASPSTIGTNSSTILTAKVVSTSAPTTPIAGTALDGLALTFAPGSLGSVNPGSVVISNGSASTTYQSGTAGGSTTPSVKLDNGTDTTSITVVAPPTANSQSVTAAFNTAKAITLTGSDPNSPARTLTYTIVTSPAHGTLSGTAPNLTYTPNANYQGTDSFTFKVNNGTSDSNTATVSITVNPGTPTANGQTVSVAHDSTGTPITLTGTDPDSPALTLTYSFAQPAHGKVAVSGSPGSPTVVYTPTTGYHGADSFTFTVNNGTNTSSTATVTLTVTPGTPTASNQAAAVAHDSTGTPIALNVTDGDDNPPLALTSKIQVQPTHGTLSGSGTTLTYTPTTGYQGTDSFSYNVTNGSYTSSTATVTLTVAPATPTASPQSVTTDQNSPVGITLAGTDGDDNPALPLTYTVTTAPTHGTLSGTAPNLTYTPAAGYSGSDGFAYTVSNGTNTSNPATVSLSVNSTVATVSGTVGIAWGTARTTNLQTDADGLRLLPSGRSTDLPWLGINRITITLSQAAPLSASDVSVTGINVANYGPVTVSGSGTTYTITLAQPINAADRVTVTIGNANIATFTRRLDVLPGDFNDDGAVTQSDAIGIRNEYLGIAGATPTLAGDINGDGVVDINDYNVTRRMIGTVLP